MKEAVLFDAICFTVRIRSFQTEYVCEAVVKEAMEGGEDQILTPEQAEMIGINLFEILDPGCERRISLGEELQDWRAFNRCPRSEMKILADAVWLESANKAVWINPRIRAVLENWNQAGYVIPSYGESPKATQEIAETSLMVPVISPVEEFRYQPQLPPAPVKNEDGVYEDWNSCSLWIATGKKNTKLCNFIPLPIRREYRFNAKGEREIIYEVRIYFFGLTTGVKIPEKKFNGMYTIVKENVDSAVICIAKANVFLERYVREHLALLSPSNDISVLIDPGWQTIGGHPVYAFDNREPNMNGFLFASGRNLHFELVSADVAWQYFKQAQNISEDRRIPAVIILYSLMGLLYTVLKKSGFVPQFLLYIVGTTGSLKTAVSKVFFNIFNMQNQEGIHSFSDTITSLELYLGALKDEVGIIDDLELGDSESESRRQKESFNLVVRLVGDSKGKNRSNSILKDVKARVTQGLVAVTGEQSLGKQSNRLRMIELEITKGAILGERLAILQDNPTRWSTICYAFIRFVEENYVEVVSYISTNSKSFRWEYQTKFCQLRTIDQLVAFRIVAELFRKMWMKTLLRPEMINESIDLMLDAVESVLTASSETDEVENPGMRFLLDLDALIGAGELKIAENAEVFLKNSIFIGYFEYGDILLLKDASYEAVAAYENRMRRRYPFDMTKILKSLSEFDAVYSFANGKNRTFNIRRYERVFFKINGEIFKQKVKATENK